MRLSEYAAGFFKGHIFALLVENCNKKTVRNH